MSSDKLRWTQPQLIVLARGMPEESVLTHCKLIHYQLGMSGPTVSAQEICDKGVTQNCGACLARAGT